MGASPIELSAPSAARQHDGEDRQQRSALDAKPVQRARLYSTCSADARPRSLSGAPPWYAERRTFETRSGVVLETYAADTLGVCVRSPRTTRSILVAQPPHAHRGVVSIAGDPRKDIVVKLLPHGRIRVVGCWVKIEGHDDPDPMTLRRLKQPSNSGGSQPRTVLTPSAL